MMALDLNIPDPEKQATSAKALTGNSGAPENAPAPELTPEEQMALYEKDLKENDWGHQPC
jgi:hypothetical protein